MSSLIVSLSFSFSIFQLVCEGEFTFTLNLDVEMTRTIY